MIKEEDDDDDDLLLLLLFLFVFLIEFTFMRLMRKGNNQRSKHKSSCYSSNIRGIIVCGSCGDRTTTPESKQVECPCVRTVNIGASVCIQYGHTPCLPIINSMNNRWINHNHSVALLFVCRAENRNGEKSKAPAPFQKRPYTVWSYSMPSHC